jgi:hypothetical protein
MACEKQNSLTFTQVIDKKHNLTRIVRCGNDRKSSEVVEKLFCGKPRIENGVPNMPDD